MKSKIVDYITEEVWRQGHDVTKQDGLQRVAWMIDAWMLALNWSGRIEIGMIRDVGATIEPFKNAKGLRKVAVCVGDRICPDAKAVVKLLNRFVETQGAWKPLENYREFEKIHPFVDGNGRTGKIILNYLNGTLDDPIFPPNDFWGKPIRNP